MIERNKIQLFYPSFHVDECLLEIKECLDNGWTGMGYKTETFESNWKNHTGFKNAYFLNSATSGLYLAVEILRETFNWSDNDEIITTGLTFISTNHAIKLAKLNPVFADVDDSLNLSPASVKQKITSHTKAIIFVGLGGNPTNLKEIMFICKEKNLKLILDAAHMSGSRIDGETAGLDADVSIFSFQAVKNLPTSDSGMICFKDDLLDKTARIKSWLGINKDTFARFSSEGNYKWKYNVESLGYKYHGNSVTAALGIVQLKYLDEDNKKRSDLAKLYDKFLDDLTSIIKRPRVENNALSSIHIYQIIVPYRDELIEYLNSFDIYPGVHYIDNTSYDMYKFAGCENTLTRFYSNQLLSLPLHLKLSDEDIEFVTKKIRNFYDEKDYI